MRALKVFESLKEASFRLYLGSRLFKSSVMSMRIVVRGLLIYRLTGSAALLGSLALAQALPMLLVSPFAGAIADRAQKKYVVLLCEAISTVLILGVAFSLTCGYMSAENAGSWWVLMVAAIIDGVLMGVSEPSRLTMIPDLVSQKRVTNAAALHQMGESVLRIAAPAPAGFIIDAFGFEAVFYTMALLNLSGLVLWLFVPLANRITTEHGSILADIKNVLQYLKKETLITAILGFMLGLVFCSMPYQSLLPIFTEDILGVEATGLGVLQSISGCGAIAGALVLASLPNKKRGTILIMSGIILGLALLSFSFSTSWYLSLAIVVIIGIGQTAQMTLSLALLQNYSSDEYRGRVMSFWGMERGISSFGAFFAGILVPTIGVQWAVGGLALLLVLFSTLVLVFAPRIRSLD